MGFWSYTHQMYKAQLAHQMEGKIVIIDLIHNKVLFSKTNLLKINIL
jgi:hypothetical protein